jgi:hypothetical protein
LNAGLLTFMVVSSASFLMCANEVNQKYDMVRQAFKHHKIKEEPKKRIDKG